MKSESVLVLAMVVLLVALTGSASAQKYSGGTGEPNDPYRIETAADLNEIGSHPEDFDDCFILLNDINMADFTYTTALIAPDTNSSGGFQGTAFTGIFDGNDCNITGLTIDTAGGDEDYLGLFGQIGGSGEVRNLVIEDVNITGGEYSYYLGGLCGWNKGTISNCSATGNVNGGVDSWYLGGLCGDNDDTISNCYATGSVTGSRYLGGLCGRSAYATISNCSANGSVTGRDDSRYLGGLCGYNWDGTIRNCYATGSVTGSRYLGGLCGENFGYFTDAIISNCYATGSVSGYRYLGGLCGWNKGTISNCSATGNVNGGVDSLYLGGLCGGNDEGTIRNCYATGSVDGNDRLGGLCGYNYGPISNCFWDTETSGMDTSYGGTGKTTAEMQTKATFVDVGWDFVGEIANGYEDIWRMCWDGGWYPRLAWQFYKWADFVCPDRVELSDFAYFAARWRQSNCADSNNCDGADLDYSGVVDYNDLKEFGELWLKGRPAPGELAVPASVDFADYAELAKRWLNEKCRLTHNCYGTDLDFSGTVNWADLKILAAHWLEGTE